MREEKTISLVVARYDGNRDVPHEIIYRGTGWKVIPDVKDYAIIEIYNNEGKVIASHKSWDNIRFTDELVKEGEI